MRVRQLEGLSLRELPPSQIDNDGDCFVECYDGTTTWKGGDYLLGDDCTIASGEDCNDADASVYIGAMIS